MPRVSARALKVLSAGLAGATALSIAAAPANAAQSHRPHPAPTANQLVKKANADFQAASSVFLWSRISEQGVTVTITQTVALQGCLLTINAGAGIWSQDLNIGTSQWVRLSDQTWQALGYTGTDLGYVSGKWVTAAAYLQVLGLSNQPVPPADCHAHEPTGLPSAGWTLGKKMIKVSGRLAWQIYDKRGGLGAAVSATRTPEFLAITFQGVPEYLSHYNAPVVLAAPPAGDVITSLPPLPPLPSVYGRRTTLTGSVAYGLPALSMSSISPRSDMMWNEPSAR
jgi:hypothetical protein